MRSKLLKKAVRDHFSTKEGSFKRLLGLADGFRKASLRQGPTIVDTRNAIFLPPTLGKTICVHTAVPYSQGQPDAYMLCADYKLCDLQDSDRYTHMTILCNFR